MNIRYKKIVIMEHYKSIKASDVKYLTSDITSYAIDLLGISISIAQEHTYVYVYILILIHLFC